MTNCLPILKTLFGSLLALCAAASEPTKPVPLHPTTPPGWDTIGTDGQGSRWFLYQGLKDSVGPRVFRVQVDMLPSDDNQVYKDAGSIGNRYLINVDCSAGTLLFVELTASSVNGTQERYVYPSTTQAQRPAENSVMVNLVNMVCK